MPRYIRITAISFLLPLLLGSAGTVRAVPVYVDADWETGGGTSSGLMARLARATQRSGDKSNCVTVPAAGKMAEDAKGATERAGHVTRNCPSGESAVKSDPNRAPKPMLRLP